MEEEQASEALGCRRSSSILSNRLELQPSLNSFDQEFKTSDEDLETPYTMPAQKERVLMNSSYSYNKP